ncbi:GAF and ANTAR domain-containing protein [Cellulomonas sp. URHB0016]
MPDPEARAAAVTDLQSILLSTAGIEEFVDGVARAAAHHVGPATSATITLRRDGRPRLIGASDGLAAQCDEVEYATDQGPCLEAIDTGALVHVPDVAVETRWPGWCAVTSAHGFASGAALPRTVRPGVATALNLYATSPHAWTVEALAVAEMYADEVARTLALCLRIADQAELNADLRAALVSRAVIDQAIGVIMAENRCSAGEAMTILRSASRHRKVKLRDVARVVVETVTGSPAREEDTFVERTRVAGLGGGA